MNRKAKKLKQIQQIKRYLLPGQYRFDRGLRIFFLVSQTSSPIVAAFSDFDEAEITIKNEQSEFGGFLVWFCMNGDWKLFSATETLTSCENRQNYQRKLANQHYFAKYFPLPELCYTDEEQLQLREAYIPFRQATKEDEHQLLTTIYYDYRHYFQLMKQTGDYQQSSFADLLKTTKNFLDQQQVELLVSNINEVLLQQEWPFLKLHGDLWSENILIESTPEFQVKYIDWDESGEYFFCYDLFKFIWNEVDVHGRLDYYADYLSGKFDRALRELFAIFELVFVPDYKKAYFCLFALNFLLADSPTMTDQIKQAEIADFIRKMLD